MKFSLSRAVTLLQDKDVLEKISSSVAMAAVLDQKQRWAAVVQVEQLRRVLAESLHQVKRRHSCAHSRIGVIIWVSFVKRRTVAF